MFLYRYSSRLTKNLKVTASFDLFSVVHSALRYFSQNNNLLHQALLNGFRAWLAETTHSPQNCRQYFVKYGLKTVLWKLAGKAMGPERPKTGEMLLLPLETHFYYTVLALKNSLTILVLLS